MSLFPNELMVSDETVSKYNKGEKEIEAERGRTGVWEGRDVVD